MYNPIQVSTDQIRNKVNAPEIKVKDAISAVIAVMKHNCMYL
jgi:hypothetical protein